ncbi:hypothetical protein FOZ60_005069 [Perkinsus olseni]|uniref:F-box domain-containing protein n=1 Tax=Perkinsus olseni TaxID=32597 RepID=A0A7J6NRQ1_PEROL|nr:hypothetical protein FOZ60_005069 [Perkinsus olseni]
MLPTSLPIDGLILEHLLPWLISDVTSAVRMASVCSSWRRSVLDYLLHEGARTGYGILKITMPRQKHAEGLNAMMKTYGRYTGELNAPMEDDVDELQEVLENGAAPNLRTLATRSLRLNRRLWDCLPKLVRLDLSYHPGIKDDDLSLCCGSLPNLTELLVVWLCVTGRGWLDGGARRKPWRVLRLERTKVPLARLKVVCDQAHEPLVELGLSVHFEKNTRSTDIEQLRKSIERCSILRVLHLSSTATSDYHRVIVYPFPSSLRVLCLSGGIIKSGFFYNGLISCANLCNLEMIRPYFEAPVEEVNDMFRWVGSNSRMRCVDFSGPSGASDEYLMSFFDGLKTISPASLSVLGLGEWNITEDMLFSLLESCPNITRLGLEYTPVTPERAAFMHGLFSGRIRPLWDGGVEFRCPVHGTGVAHEHELWDGFRRLLEAGGRIWQLRTEPTYKVEIPCWDGDFVESFCDKGPTDRCAAESFSRGRVVWYSSSD